MIEILIDILAALLVVFGPIIIVYVCIGIDYIIHHIPPVYVKDICKEVKSLDFFGFLWFPIINWVFLGFIIFAILCDNKILSKAINKIMTSIGNIRLK